MKIIRGETVPWTSVMSIFIMNLVNDRTNKQTNKKVSTFSVTVWVTQDPIT